MEVVISALQTMADDTGGTYSEGSMYAKNIVVTFTVEDLVSAVAESEP